MARFVKVKRDGAAKRMSIARGERVEVVPCVQCGKLTANLSKECRYCLDVQAKFVEASRRIGGGR